MLMSIMAIATNGKFSKNYLLAAGEAAKYELARRHYANYVELVHHGRWQRADHLNLVCDELEKVLTGETKRLMIFMPPRHGKSMTVTKTFPSYYLGKNPNKRVIEVSYGDELAKEFGEANRAKVFEFGQKLFGINLSMSQATKTNWNLQGYDGGMISAGIGGVITGKGADLLLIDDPIKNRAEAESETFRRRAIEAYQSDIRTRLHAGGAIIIILTRWHESDLAGWLLNPENGEVEDWKILSLPAICDDEERDLLHRKSGQALWPAGGYDEKWQKKRKRLSGVMRGHRSICKRRLRAKAECSVAAGGNTTKFCPRSSTKLYNRGTARSKTRKNRTTLWVKSGAKSAQTVICSIKYAGR